MAGEIREDDVGTIFRLTINDGSSAVDISGATVKQLLFKKPDGSVLTKAGAFFTDGTDGILQYTIIDELNAVGQWDLQAKVALAAGTWKSTRAGFFVHANL